MFSEHHRDEFTISTDPARLDLNVIHQFLTNSYWAAGIPMELVKKSVQHSLNFGVYHGAEQIGFARLVTDYATFAYLADVFILEAYRGRGLSKWLMEVILSQEEVQGLRRWMLATRDAHGLYAQFGFVPIPNPERFMQLHFPDVYQKTS